MVSYCKNLFFFWPGFKHCFIFCWISAPSNFTHTQKYLTQKFDVLTCQNLHIKFMSVHTDGCIAKLVLDAL